MVSKKLRAWIIAIVAVNVIISHVVLPVFFDNKDFFIFYNWKLFSFDRQYIWADITWDNGKTYLFRDHRAMAKKSGVDIHTLFYLTHKYRSDRIRKDFLHILRRLGPCEDIEYVKFKASLFKYLLQNGEIEVVSREKLCND